MSISSFKQVVIKHKVALFLAVLTSIIVALPQVYFRIDHKDLYQEGIQGIEMLPDSPWSARVREVQDGHPNFGSIYYKDGKDDPYLFQPLGSIVVAYTGKLFSLGINDTLLLSRFLLPFFTFLLIYIFVYLLSRDKLAALTSGSVILMTNAILNPSGVMHVLTGQLLQGVSPISFLEIAKPVNPAMIFILFFGFLTTFWLFYQKKNLYWGVASAVILGLNFYNYFYSWTYLYAFGGILGLVFLIQRKWTSAARVAGVYVGALLVAIPYGWNLYQASLSPLYEDIGLWHGLVSSHKPLFVGIVVVTGLLIFFLGFPREDKERYFFGMALMLTPFVTLNQQVLTGTVLQPGHYHWYFHRPIAVVFAIVTIFYVLTKYRWLSHKKILAVLMITASFSVGFSIQAVSYFNDNEGRDGGRTAIERQKYAPAMHWLSVHAPKESVVLANNEASHVTVIYTSLNVFHHRSAQLSLSATRERLLDALFTFYRLRGIGEKEIRDVVYQERESVSSQLYGIHYRDAFGSYASIPDEILNEIINRYRSTLSISTSAWLQEVLRQYEVEYLVWDKKIDPNWRLSEYTFLSEVAAFDDIAIYMFSLE